MAQVVRHVVLFKFKPDVPAARVAETMEQLKGLKDKIPGIINFHIGQNNSPEGLNKGLEHGFTCDFVDAKARDTYLTHDEHMAVVNKSILPFVESKDDICVFDFDLVQ